MKFFDRWKKRSFEEKMDDLSQTVLTENNIKDPKQVEQYVVERLEQMIDITREIEEEKSEYRTVTSYLNDVQKLEDLPEPEKKKIADVAQNVVQLNSARNIFLNSEKKLTDAQFTQLQQEEKTMPDAIKRLVIWLVLIHNVFNAAAYPFSGALSNGLRAAGDVKFTMYVSVISTIAVRLLLSWLLGIVLKMGVIGIAIAMVCDWSIRAVIFFFRQKSEKWKTFQVI